MSAAKKKGKTSKKPIRFELSLLALAGWCLGLLLALLWMFALGLFVGKGIAPTDINLAQIKKRMQDVPIKTVLLKEVRTITAEDAEKRIEAEKKKE